MKTPNPTERDVLESTARVRELRSRLEGAVKQGEDVGAVSAELAREAKRLALLLCRLTGDVDA